MRTEEGKKQGMLILIGGAEDKRDDKLVLKKMLEKTKAKNIAIIPTASYYSREVHESYYDAFRNLGAENIETLDIRYSDEADREEYHEKVEKADLIYFGGGDQTKLIKTLEGSQLLEKIKSGFFNNGLHIAGTSAGAAAAGHLSIYDGDYQGFNKDAVRSIPGFGFIDDLIVDTHFLARERIPRLIQFLISGDSTKGIGIDEDTAVFIYPDLRFEVHGSGMVTIVNTDKITGSNYHELNEKQVYSINNIRIGFLAPGTTFSIKRWSILKTSAERNLKDFPQRVFLNY
jgi:cyanophycinase